jgi:hypothetical protein
MRDECSGRISWVGSSEADRKVGRTHIRLGPMGCARSSIDRGRMSHYTNRDAGQPSPGTSWRAVASAEHVHGKVR